jgi:maltose alpha-D-glucosyltransferase/alpha-amylase
VDCIWLLPFFESPLRDGGYDISDFFTIQPDYGTVDDVRDFIEAAHQRGIRVIADLVMNHTSSDHPWFQEARSAPDTPKRDWYVWSDTVHKYEDARIIFTDTETSNWTWDEQAGAYFWHRFFSHQPDLNFDNPEVQEAMLEVLRFWLDLGMDGFRLDAVPYLYEREGTNGENLPETHAYLKRVRARSRPNYPDRVLLAEANQWPADVVEYFGDGDECHMAFHFPGDAAHVHGAAARDGQADLRDPAPDPGDPGQLPVGPVPAQPRRADARDGHRRGAGLHVRGVRKGPADEDQRRHPPAARAAAGRRAATRSS